MYDYRRDPDIDAIFSDGAITVPGDLDAAEAERVNVFVRCQQELGARYQRGEPLPPELLISAAEAGKDVYEQRTPRLPMGWQKFVVLQVGKVGIETESVELMEWVYWLCRDNDGWLGNFDEDIDRNMPLRAMMQEIPPMTMTHFRRSV